MSHNHFSHHFVNGVAKTNWLKVIDRFRALAFWNKSNKSLF